MPRLAAEPAVWAAHRGSAVLWYLVRKLSSSWCLLGRLGSCWPIGSKLLVNRGERRHPGSIRACSLYCATTFLGAENSEVLPPGPVAVAVMFCPSRIAFFVEKVKEMLPVPLVVTDLLPSRVLPSSVPEGLEKSCTRKVLSGVLLRLPRTVVVPVALFFAEERTGLFWRLLGPVSASPGSFAVGPSSFRSIPIAPFEKMELESMRLPVASSP